LKKALIFGVSGQDGSYLAELLLGKNYVVYGASRDILATSFGNLSLLGIKDKVELISVDLSDFRSVLKVVDQVQPNEIYNLAGQTSVGLSFQQPVEAMESIAGATLNLLEVIRFINPEIRFYNAGSSDCFGDTGVRVASETTPFNPCSPYGVAKSTAHFLVNNYRLAYGLYASTGILFNHESPLRPIRFVTQKIVSTASRIAKGSDERLSLGDVSIARDWGWAPDYVDAMWRMLQLKEAEDFVVATGKTITLEEFVCKTFDYFALDWREYVDFQPSLLRPSDIAVSRGDPQKAKELLGWTPTIDVDGVIERMCATAVENSALDYY
jgi:GDPmannose 4,6-dehydratase